MATVAKPAEVGPSYLPTYIIMYKWTLIADENWIILFAYQLPRDNGRSRSGLLRISASSSLSSINYYRLFPDAGQVGKPLRAGNRASKREICLFPSRLGFKSKSSFAWIRHCAANNVLGLASSSSSSIGRYLRNTVAPFCSLFSPGLLFSRKSKQYLRGSFSRTFLQEQ